MHELHDIIAMIGTSDQHWLAEACKILVLLSRYVGGAVCIKDLLHEHSLDQKQ